MSLNKLPECVQWLADFMRSHPIVECRTVRGEAYKKGFGQRELREAKKILGLITDLTYNEKGQKVWQWRLGYA